MKTFKKLLASSLLILFVLPVFSQNLISFERKFIYALKGKSKIVQSVLLIDNFPNRQRVLQREFSIPPDSIAIKDGVMYALFGFKNIVKNDTFSISVKTTLLIDHYDLKTAKRKKIKPDLTENLEKYLKSEQFIQKDSPAIRKAAQNITGIGREEIVKNIYEFVTGHLTYTNFKNGYRGARLAFQQGKGDCTEYSELMVALCRAKGIPARMVMGAVAFSGTTNNPYHNWVEVWFDEYGWVAFDPTFGDGENLPTNYETMLNTYIYMVYSRDNNISRTDADYYPDITYEMHTNYLLKETEQKIERLFKDKKYKEALASIDFLTDSGFKNSNLFNTKARIFIKKKDYPNALTNLQAATRNAHIQNEKQKIFYTWAIYFAQQGEIEKGINFLKKSLETEDFRSKNYLFEDPDLKPLKAHRDFTELTKKHYQNYLKRTSKSEFLGLDLLDDYKLLIQKKEEHSLASNGSFSDLVLTKLETEKKIKFIDIYFKDKLSDRFEFFENGKLKGHSKRGATYKKEIFYNEESNEIRIVKKRTTGNTLKSKSEYVLKYDNSDLIKEIIRKVELPGIPEQKTTFIVERKEGNPNLTEVLESNGQEETRRFYEFSENGNLIHFHSVHKGDTVTTDFIYEEDGLSCERILKIKDIEPEISKIVFNRNGKIILGEHGISETKYFYNKEGKLIKLQTSFKGENPANFIYTYKYKKGLPAEVLGTDSNNKNSKYKRTYKYTFYE